MSSRLGWSVVFGEPEENLEEITWEAFFAAFGSDELALPQDEPDGRRTKLA